MLSTVRNMAIAWGIVGGFFLAATANSIAQTEPSQSLEFERIQVGEDTDWEFKGENESISVEDDLEQLQDYSISGSEESDVRLTESERRWGNRGDAEDYTIETEVYGY